MSAAVLILAAAVALTNDTLTVRGGSALDFSRMRPTVGRAGDLGRVIATNGHFAFAGDPAHLVRFFGVNLCSEASVMPEDRSERFAKMLARRGYNAVRFHHQDASMTTQAYDGTLNATKMKRFDKLVKHLIDEGVYFTLDLQVTRRISWKACGIDREGLIDKYGVKELIVTDPNVFSNYSAFALRFLTHVNPLTGRDYAHEPAMIGVSLINELSPRKISAKEERDFFCRMKALFAEVGCAALVTDLNLGQRFDDDMQQVRRDLFDYADAHRYVSHPKFLTADKKGGLKMDFGNPLRRDLSRLMPEDGQRIAGKPAVITEWNWPVPCPWRFASGLVTGSLSAFDGWDGLWRFTWSHSGEGAEFVKPLCCFDIASDPVNRLSEYAMAALFMRGDGDCGRFAGGNGKWCVESQRTCGVASEGGLDRAGVLEVSLDSPGAFWVSSLDGKPLADSDRVVAFHLTDARMTGATFAEDGGTVLTAWGAKPVRIRCGRAEVALSLGIGAWKVRALGIDGTPLREIPCSCKNGRLTFVADTASVPGSPTLAYELFL